MDKRAYYAAVAGASFATFAGVFWYESLPPVSRVIDRLTTGRRTPPPPGAFYSGCDDARAAGVAPLYRGEPGYAERMDGDGDGIACEPIRGN